MNITRKTDDDGLGSIEFRTQTEDESMWRAAMTPSDGQEVVFEAIDETRFRIKVVNVKGAPQAPRETPLETMTKENLLDLAAKLGVDAKPLERKADILVKVKNAQGKETD